jgi:hypothetical protein
MAASDGGHIWPCRASDPRIQEFTGGDANASKPDDVFVTLRGLGYTGSLDDMWNQHKAANGITDTSEPFTDSVAGGATFETPDNYSVNQNVAGTASNCGVALNADGTLIITCGIFLDDVVEHDMSTPYDLTSASTGTAWDDLANVTIRELRFSGTGLHVYYIDEFDDILTGSPLSSAYDLSTAGAANDNFDYSSQITAARSFEFGNGGLKLYIGSFNLADDIIAEYTLSSAYDVSTAVHVQSLSVNAFTQSVNGIAFNQDTGEQVMIIDGDSPFKMTLGTLTTPWDISTCTFDTTNTLTLAAQPYGLTYGGGHFYTTDFTNSKLLRIS